MESKIRNFKTSRQGKTALRNYCRWVMNKCRARWLSANGKWENDTIGKVDESVLADRLEILMVKWSERDNAVLVCVHDKNKPMDFSHWDGNEYRWIYVWNNMEFWHVWEMVSNLARKILYPKLND